MRRFFGFRGRESSAPASPNDVSEIRFNGRYLLAAVGAIVLAIGLTQVGPGLLGPRPASLPDDVGLAVAPQLLSSAGTGPGGKTPATAHSRSGAAKGAPAIDLSWGRRERARRPVGPRRVAEQAAEVHSLAPEEPPTAPRAPSPSTTPTSPGPSPAPESPGPPASPAPVSAPDRPAATARLLRPQASAQPSDGSEEFAPTG